MGSALSSNRGQLANAVGKACGNKSRNDDAAESSNYHNNSTYHEKELWLVNGEQNEMSMKIWEQIDIATFSIK